MTDIAIEEAELIFNWETKSERSFEPTTIIPLSR